MLGDQSDKRWHNAKLKLRVKMCSLLRSKNEIIWSLGRFDEEPVTEWGALGWK